MEERALALDHDHLGDRPIRLPARGLEHQGLSLPGHEVRGHRVHHHAAIGHEDAGLAGGHERRGGAALAQGPHQLERRGHLAHVAVRAHGEHHGGLERRGAAGRDRAARGRAAHVVDARAARARQGRQLGIVGEEGVEAGEHVPAALERVAHAVAPGGRQLAALRRHAHQQAVGAEPRGILELRHHRDLPAHPHAGRGGPSGARRVQHRHHLLGPVAQHPDRRLGVQRREAPLRQQRESPKLAEHPPYRSESYTWM